MAITHAMRVNMAVTVVTILMAKDMSDVIYGHDVLSVDYDIINKSSVLSSAADRITQSDVRTPNIHTEDYVLSSVGSGTVWLMNRCLNRTVVLIIFIILVDTSILHIIII